VSGALQSGHGSDGTSVSTAVRAALIEAARGHGSDGTSVSTAVRAALIEAALSTAVEN
jgi:hypothetical protein